MSRNQLKHSIQIIYLQFIIVWKLICKNLYFGYFPFNILYKFFWFRLLNVFAIAYLLLLSISTIQACKQSKNFNQCLSEQAISVISVGNVEGFSILVAAILYIFESSNRKKSQQYEAWQVIDNAFAAQVPTSIARVKALEQLCKDGVSLRSIDLPEGADLNNIILLRSDLSKADLKGVDLSFGDLRLANLQRANLESSNLIFANFRGATLRGANLRTSIIGGANFVEADLSNAQLEKAQLGGDSIQVSDLDLENDLVKLLIIILRNLSYNPDLIREIEINNQIFNEKDLRSIKSYLIMMRSENISRFIKEIIFDSFYFPEAISYLKLTTNFDENIAKINNYLNTPKVKNMLGANLCSACLKGANLRDANLRGVNLRNANLTNTDLRGADLRNANLQGTDLMGSLYSQETQLPINFDPMSFGMIIDSDRQR